MEEFAKQQAVKKAKWTYLTKMFYDPEGAQQHERQQEREGRRTITSGSAGEPADNYIPLVPQFWKQPFLDLKQLHVMKMPRVLQTLFYLLCYNREDICEVDTNKLDLKKVRELINEDLFQKMAQYNPFGKKEEEFKEYQKLNFLDKNIGSVEEDRLDEYSVILGRIHRWVTQAIELRIDDVRSRRDNIAQLQYDRE